MDAAYAACDMAAGDSVIARTAARQGGAPILTDRFKDVKRGALPIVEPTSERADEVVEYNFVVGEDGRVNPCTIRSVAQTSPRFAYYGGEILLRAHFVPYDSITPRLPALVRQRIRVQIK
jgi:hypothetical protein